MGWSGRTALTPRISLPPILCLLNPLMLHLPCSNSQSTRQYSTKAALTLTTGVFKNGTVVGGPLSLEFFNSKSRLLLLPEWGSFPWTVSSSWRKERASRDSNEELNNLSFFNHHEREGFWGFGVLGFWGDRKSVV